MPPRSVQAQADLEIAARKRKREQMLSALLPEQQALILDPALLKASFCTRRAGKSFGIGMYLMFVALAYPGSSSLYLGLTKATALSIMNKDILDVINRRHKIGAGWRGSGKQGANFWKLPNGSLIYMRGADANSYEIQKVIGQKYRLAVLDEASKYRHNVRDMVYGSLLPAMGDDLGTILLSGTPSNITTGLFFDVTRPELDQREPGWEVHTWRWEDNTFAYDNLRARHDKLLADNPLYSATPLYKQEWLGKWVVDLDALVYKAREDFNTIDVLPRPLSEYTFVLGVDTGFKDATAFVVGAYSEHDPVLYLVEASKETGLIYSKVAQRILALQAKYSNLVRIVVDAPLQGAEEMRQRYQIPIEATEKSGKKSVIDHFNSDLLTGRIKVLPDAMGIFEEWGALIWDDKAARAVPQRWVEDGRFPNHLSDAALYLYRASRNYTATAKPPLPPAPGTEAWQEAWLEKEFAAARARRAQGNRPILDAPETALKAPWSRGRI